MGRTKGTLSRESWIKAARKIFISSGIDEVKIDRLAKALKVTRGSFYWHFKGIDDLRSALLQDWQERNLAEMDAVRALWSDRAPSINDVGAIWLQSDPDFPNFGMAVRVWAARSQMVASVVRSIDHAWIKLIEQAFRSDGRSEIESLVRARVLYHHRIGYWAFPLPETLEERCKLSPYFYEVFTGRKPDKSFYEFLDGLTPADAKPRRRA